MLALREFLSSRLEKKIPDVSVDTDSFCKKPPVRKHRRLYAIALHPQADLSNSSRTRLTKNKELVKLVIFGTWLFTAVGSSLRAESKRARFSLPSEGVSRGFAPPQWAKPSLQ